MRYLKKTIISEKDLGNGLVERRWLTSLPTGANPSVHQCTFLHDKKHGVLASWYKHKISGVWRRSRIAHYVHGLRHGWTYAYRHDPAGNKDTVSSKNLFENGQRALTIEFMYTDRPTGLVLRFTNTTDWRRRTLRIEQNETGQIETGKINRQGLKHGSWVVTGGDGTALEKEYYYNGKLLRRRILLGVVQEECRYEYLPKNLRRIVRQSSIIDGIVGGISEVVPGTTFFYDQIAAE